MNLPFLDSSSEIVNDIDLECMLVMSGTYFTRSTQYAVIVEAWKKRTYGRGARLYAEAFSGDDQFVLDKLVPTLTTWHVVDGAPAKLIVRPSTIDLLIRAVKVFAEI